jgi:hypothetical protein
MKKIVQIFALILVMASCENDIKTNLPAFLGEKDNIAWRASDTKVTANPGGTITINAYKDNELVTLTVPNSVGIHYLGTTTLGVNATYSSSNQQSLLFYETALIEGPVFKLQGVTIPGTGYAALNGNNVTTTGGSGNGLTLKIQTNSSGAVTGATIVSRGIGYEPGDLITINGGNGNAKVTVLNVSKSNGEVVVEKIEGNLYSGTFKFNAVDEQGTVVNFNKGIFYKVPIL